MRKSFTACDRPRVIDDAALWISDVPGYGVVRTVVREGSYAARFDDLNGDGREVELTLFARTEDGWAPIAGHDDVDYPSPGESAVRGWAGEKVWAVGRAKPGSAVTVAVGGRALAVRADSDGWWLGVIEVEDSEGLDLWEGPSLRIRYA